MVSTVREVDPVTWPRGKYNGQRIVGVVLKARLDVRRWRFGLPNRFGTCLSVGPLHVWFEAAYDELGKS